jgi:hypothetical protein
VATGGKLATGVVITAELSSDGITESFGVDGRGVGTIAGGADNDTAGIAGAAADADAKSADPSTGNGAGAAGAAVGDRADIPGGGDATTSGSSISSNGKSANASSKGATGTPAKPFGNASLAAEPVAAAPAAEPPIPKAVAVDPKADEAPPVEPMVAGSAAAVPEPPPRSAAAVIGTEAVALLVALAPEALELATPEPDFVEAAVTGFELVALVPVTPVESPAGGFPVGELTPGANPTGLIAFSVPVAATSLDDVLGEAARAGAEALEEVAPLIGTPTGLEVPADAGTATAR